MYFRYKRLSEKRFSSAKKLDFENTDVHESAKCSKNNETGNEELLDIDFEVIDSKSDEISKLKLQLQDKEREIAMYHNELISRNDECYKLRESADSNVKQIFGFNSIKHSSDSINFYTGLPNFDTFTWVLNRVESGAEKFHTRLSSADHLLIVFMKLRLGLLNKDIAFRFGIKCPTISKIFRCWVKVAAMKLKCLIVWPDKGAIRYNLPPCFTKKYRDAVCIIDCSEIFIQRPTNLTARAQTWSNYKHNNTSKYLIGISPAGAVMFLSTGWGGRVSDKQITLESGFIY